ncbi:MAG: hypothetical protein HYT76_09270 [Deltaproteobacteria bacterium]|nr:hypothetical protein [Deltaproteobacteria bacterium]
MSTTKTQQLLDELLSKDPAKTSLDIYSFIQQHKRLFLEKFGNFVKQFEDLFNELNLIIQLLNYVPKDGWKQSKGAQYLLYPETMKTLHRAFEDTIDGYYDEAMILNRSVYETFLRVVFASCYPSDYESIFVPIAGKRAFNVTNFVKDDLKLNWEFLYSIMSAIHHSKKTKHLRRMNDPSQQKNPIILEYESSEDGMAMCVNITCFNLTCLFHAIASIFETDFPNHPDLKLRIDRIHKIDEALLGIIEANPKKDFSNLSSDIRKIGMIIKASGQNQDWKKVV